MNKGQLESIAVDLERGLSPDEVLFKYRLTTYEINNLIGQLKPNSALARRLRSFVSNARLSISSPNTGRFGSGGEVNLEAELLAPAITELVINADGVIGTLFFNMPVQSISSLFSPSLSMPGDRPFTSTGVAQPLGTSHTFVLEDGPVITSSETELVANYELGSFNGAYHGFETEAGIRLPSRANIPVTNNSTVVAYGEVLYQTEVFEPMPIPASVTRVKITCVGRGARGANGGPTLGGGASSTGAFASATFEIAPGQQLFAFISEGRASVANEVDEFMLTAGSGQTIQFYPPSGNSDTGTIVDGPIILDGKINAGAVAGTSAGGLGEVGWEILTANGTIPLTFGSSGNGGNAPNGIAPELGVNSLPVVYVQWGIGI